MFQAQQLGRYHLMDRVAFGGMAEIFRAKTFDSEGQEHVVAVKRVLQHLAEDDDFLQMLVDEARVASLLDHPNIAKVFEFVRCGEEYFIAMEFIDGKDVRTILDRCRSTGHWLPCPDCVYVMIRVLDALHAAHEKRDGTGAPLKIVHRDVSPSNVIVSYDGQVKLCDFGIAKATMTRVQTRTGVIKGKVRYMSPEQAFGRPLDRRTDIFSAGSVLYEMLTQRSPFTAENEMELIFRVRDAKIQRPSTLNPSVSPGLDRVIKRAMSRAPGGRYASAAEFATALREQLKEMAPGYSPRRLGRFIRELFADDIALERERLAEFELGQANPGELGDNLLAEVLGEGAPYTKFTPVDPRALGDETAARTRIMPRAPVPESRLPDDVDLHDMKTAIIDREEREGRIVKRKRRPRPGALHRQHSQRETQAGTIQIEPRAPAPSSDDLHAADTRILDRRNEGHEGREGHQPPQHHHDKTGVHQHVADALLEHATNPRPLHAASTMLFDTPRTPEPRRKDRLLERPTAPRARDSGADDRLLEQPTDPRQVEQVEQVEEIEDIELLDPFADDGRRPPTVLDSPDSNLPATDEVTADAEAEDTEETTVSPARPTIVD